MTPLETAERTDADLELTEEVPGLFRLADQRRPSSKLVLCHHSELVLMVLGQPNHHIGALLGVIGDMDPGLPVFLSLLNHVVGDLRSTIICGRAPGQADPVRKHLGKLDWSNRRARRSCRGRERKSVIFVL